MDTLAQLQRLKALEAKRARLEADNPIVYAYIANPQQHAFHQCLASLAVIIGGNQGGKTFGVVADVSQHVTHQRKYRWRDYNGAVKWATRPATPDRKLKIRYMALDFTKVEEIVLPHFYTLLPPQLIDTKRGTKWPGYNGDSHILYIVDPHRPHLRHEIHFATYDQLAHKIEGGAFDLLCYDEPPPKKIFDGNKVRLLKSGGRTLMALTPIEEIPWPIEWIHHDIVCKADGKRIAVFKQPTRDNAANLAEGAIEEISRDMTEHQRAVRLEGEFGFLKGLVYKQFQRDVHLCKPYDVRRRVRAGEGLVYVGLDHGYRNPTAVSWWHIVGEWPDVKGVKFMEYLASGLTIPENCHNILEMTGDIPVEAWLADPVNCWTIDPETGTQLAEHYWDCGLPIQKADNDVNKGHDTVATLLEPMMTATGQKKPRIWFFETLEESITAYMSYAWQHSRTRHGGEQKEKPEEKYKHIPDTDRYVWTAYPSGVPMEAPPPPMKGHFGIPLIPIPPERRERRVMVDDFAAQELRLLGDLQEADA